MSFGRLMNKFRILKAPLHCSIENAPRLFLLAATHLHNYCINEGEMVKELDPNEPPPLFLLHTTTIGMLVIGLEDNPS